MTGALVALLRNSSLALANPWLLLFSSLGLLLGTQFTDYFASPLLKHLLWGGFVGTMALTMLPLI